MVANNNTHTIQQTARIAGMLYLALGVLSVFSLVYVPSVLLVAGDATATAANAEAQRVRRDRREERNRQANPPG